MLLHGDKFHILNASYFNFGSRAGCWNPERFPRIAVFEEERKRIGYR